MQNYKDLKGWEKAHSFTLKIYEITSTFPKDELYSSINQIRGSASSIPANIAKGCGKNLQNDLDHFSNIGSQSETARAVTYNLLP